VIDPHKTYSPGQVWREVGCPRAMVYADLGVRLRAVRRGRRWIIPGSAVIQWVEAMGAES
jgi:hypothetical protein